mgnify:CR=1 FL=1
MIAIITTFDVKNNRIVTLSEYGKHRFPFVSGITLEANRTFAVNEINRRFYSTYTFNHVTVMDYPNRHAKKIHVIELC